MNKIYILSGLGVDRRVFDSIDFGDLDPEFIDWIEPIYSESLVDYAKRIVQLIPDKNPILIGLSFGGMVAIEISKIIQTEKLILIASAKTKYELPLLYRIAGILKLNKLIPTFFLKQQNFITNWFFGVTTTKDRQLLRTILLETNPRFLKWAIHEIANWNNEFVPNNYIHIHGNADKIIPIKNVKHDFLIEGGGHFMTVNKAKQIEKILLNNLREIREKKTERNF